MHVSTSLRKADRRQLKVMQPAWVRFLLGLELASLWLGRGVLSHLPQRGNPSLAGLVETTCISLSLAGFPDFDCRRNNRRYLSLFAVVYHFSPSAHRDDTRCLIAVR